MPNKISAKVATLLSTRLFFWTVIGLFIAQATWLAFSLAYPIIFDEKFHFGVIQIFSHQWAPIISHQPTAYDYYRDLSHESSYTYHYLMSFPYRIFAQVMGDPVKQIIALRMINIGFVAAGLVVYAKLLREVGISLRYISLGILLFTLLPMVPHVAATINYDNLLFLLAAWYMLICVRAIQVGRSGKLPWLNYISLVGIGSFASLAKYSFLPVFAGTLLYLVVDLIIKIRHGVPLNLRNWFVHEDKMKLAIVSSLALLSVGWFTRIYVMNVINYGVPNPACRVTLSLKRCEASDVVRRNIQAEATKDNRPAAPLPDYTLSWVANMLRGSSFAVANTVDNHNSIKEPLPIFYNLLFFGSILSLVALAVVWKALNKGQEWQFVFISAILVIASVYILNVSDYYKFHAAYANQPRYLFVALPILSVMIVDAWALALRGRNWAKALLFVGVMGLVTQGGGATTLITRSNDNWYWQNPKVIKANHVAKRILQPLIKK
jgi:hypothetical protein